MHGECKFFSDCWELSFQIKYIRISEQKKGWFGSQTKRHSWSIDIRIEYRYENRIRITTGVYVVIVIACSAMQINGHPVNKAPDLTLLVLWRYICCIVFVNVSTITHNTVSLISTRNGWHGIHQLQDFSGCFGVVLMMFSQPTYWLSKTVRLCFSQTKELTSYAFTKDRTIIIPTFYFYHSFCTLYKVVVQRTTNVAQIKFLI